ncbi:hypothetical protein HU200_033210 [Digitaria exilis]|uniref:Uncharacterized protein n=1 Tax=Digitaria exilis TaxID=1010633 RepID=A0A835EPR2_9POAL|nr:hypothetical protein HU200_033210 [Digitaria exilis]
MATSTPLYGEISDYRHPLVDYVGDGFLIGASFGSAYHFTRGALRRRSPPSGGGRLAGGVRAVRNNVPLVAGRCGAQLAVFWAVESAASAARGVPREDHWNTIAAGAATCGLASARRGAPAAAALFALLGAAAFAGLAGAWWIMDVDAWHSRRRREVQMNRGSPDDLVAIGPCRTVRYDPILGCESCSCLL